MNLNANLELQNGKYRIEKTLGQGGFGITYLATQVGLNRKVAIKEFFMKEYCYRDETTASVSLGTVANNGIVMRFRGKFIKEAQNIAVLNHPHIIRIYDIFEENNTAYYVMEYLDNDSLSDYVRQKGRLSEKEALHFIRQIANALAYIHEHKINHLDVKPGNILLDSKNNAILIDFGLAKCYDDAGNQTSTTPVGISHGYAPLEQYKNGGVGTFSPTTDIYSLAATLFKLVTGQTPPDAGDVNEDGLPEFPSDISQSTINAITKAMQGSRKKRPQTINEFLKLLDKKNVKCQNSDDETKLDIYSKTDTVFESTKKTIPPTPPKKKKNKVWIFILLALIISTAGFYIVFEKIQTNKKIEEERFVQEQAEQERIKKEQEAAQIAQVQKEAEEKAQAQAEAEKRRKAEAAEKKRKEEEARLKAKMESELKMQADVEMMSLIQNVISDKNEYDNLLMEGDSLLNIENFTEAKLKFEKAVEYENKYKKSEYSYYFNKGAKNKITETITKNEEKIKAIVKEEQKKQEEARLKAEEETRKVAELKRQEEEKRLKAEAEAKAKEMAEKKKYNGHEYVDLGLSVKWATCNIGANSPDEYGGYYAWGETKTKSAYTENKSTTYGKKFGNITCDSVYDAAQANWNGNWRLPTEKEFEELKNKCTWELVTQNKIKGYKITGANGNNIFLPLAGYRYKSSLNHDGDYGNYWTSTADELDNNNAHSFYINNNNKRILGFNRSYGLSIRPVIE